MDNVKHAVLIGLLLGDLHLQQVDSNTQKCRMRLCHQLSQRDYLDYIHQLFIDWCQKTKAPYETTTKKGYSEYQFCSEYREELIEYHSLFYQRSSFPGRKFEKKLPDNLDQLLTNSIILAVWFMDDGTKRTDCNAGRIATQGFTADEQIRLKDCIWNNFSIRVEIDTWHTTEGKEIQGLSIPSTDGHFERWCDLIRPLIESKAPQMLYKLRKSETP